MSELALPETRPVKHMIARRSVVDAIDAGLSFYRREYQTILSIVFLFYGPLYALKTTACVLDLIPMERVFNGFGFIYSASYSPGNLVILLIDTVVQPLCGGALTFFIHQRACAIPFSNGQVVSFLRSQAVPVFVSSCFATLASLTLLLFCIIPGIWAAVLLVFIIPIVVVEKINTFEGLWGRCKDLAGGKQWIRLLGFGTLSVILLGLLGLSLSYLLSGIYALILEQMSWLSGIVPDRSLLPMIAGAITSLLLLPIHTIFVMIMYYDARSRKEGFDIEMALRRL